MYSENFKLFRRTKNDFGRDKRHTAAINLVYALRESLALLAEEVQTDLMLIIQCVKFVIHLR